MTSWIAISLARLVVIGIAAAIGLYLSVVLFQVLTPGVDAWREIARGNTAVGSVMAAVMVAVAIVVLPIVSVPLEGLDIGPGAAVTILLVDGLRILFGMGVAVLAVVLSAALNNLMTGPINEKLELQRGNLAVGILQAGVIVATALVISAPAAALVRGLLEGLVR